MKKKVLLTLAAIALIAISVEAIALLRLKNSIPEYAQYWSNQNKTARGEFVYVALGDSTAQGIGASKPEYSYPGLLADRIEQETGQQVRLINVSKSGAHVDNVLDQQLRLLKQYKPDLVTIEIGANDVTNFNNQKFKREFTALAERLPANTYVSDMPYFGGILRKNNTALEANTIIYDAIKDKDLRLVKMQKITRERQSLRGYAPDLFHPSNHGYQNWADAFWLEIKPNLRKQL